MSQKRFQNDIAQLIILCIICLSAIIAFDFGQNRSEQMHFEEYVSQGYTVYINGVKVDKPDKIGELKSYDEITYNEEEKEIYLTMQQ